MEENKIYWKGLEQLENNEDFQARVSKEFPEYLPVNSGEDGEPSRRDFLKMMGFGMAAVSLAACEAPVRKAIPYVNKPVDVDPGIANFYASTYTMGNDYCSVVVKTREGRPIKIEGNKLSKVSGGGTTTQVEASVLSLYDEQRLRNPRIGEEDATWEEVDKRIKLELNLNTRKTVIVSYSNCSPSTQRAVETLNEKYGNVEWIQYDPVSFSGILEAYEKTSGNRVLPVHDFSKAKTIVSFGADFLGNWPNQTMNSRQFASTRKLDDDKKEMSRLYSFESNLSLTGSNADYRQPIKPSEEGLFIANLYNLIAQKAGVTIVGVPKVENTVVLEKAANDLWKSKRNALVLSGSNDANVQQLVIAINDLLDSYGNTIDSSKSMNTRKGDDKAFAEFVNELEGGQVGTVVFYNCNPVYDHPLGNDIASSINQAQTSISTSDRVDETATIVKYLTPDHHYLESWNDFEPVTGHLSLAQPTISNIFNTRQAQESFLRWADVEDTYYDFLRSGWKPLSSGIFDTFWDQCLYNGVYDRDDSVSSLSISVDVLGIADKIKNNYQVNSFNTELVLYSNYSVGDGVQANNPWLQEMPDPITKACWDNYLTVSPRQARENGWRVKDGDMDYKIATLTVDDKSVQVPVIPQPGQAYGTVGLALGYGRTKSGPVGDHVGINAYQFVAPSNSGLKFSANNVSVDVSEQVVKVPQTQTSQTYVGRETVIQETVLKEYQKNASAGRYTPEISTLTGKKKPYAISLWKDHEYTNHHWGMIVDLNSCTGCGTCTIACQTENNIPVVGKQEVLNRREMHWIRIDRYYSSRPEDEITKDDLDSNVVDVKEIAADNPEVTFQPMMCQHCNAAPCETVCPVAATTHSTEGLNMMAYNRCVGTRYCANNCPYKVRRFNWFKYHDNSQFDTNTSMNNDLGKMVLNPDVTVRSRGVMEKCSFCVQRIQAGKLKAKKESRRPIDGEITTACVKACPSEALVFGDMKDSNSRIYKKLKIKETKKSVEAREGRAYHVLEELRVMPNVWYLTKVRNKDENKEKAEA